jgi:hypothetical protein
MHRVLHEKEAWQPLRPRKAVLEAGRESIVIEFTVPRPPLVIDTSFSRGRNRGGGRFQFVGRFSRAWRRAEGGGDRFTDERALRFAKALPAGEKCR